MRRRQPPVGAEDNAMGGRPRWSRGMFSLLRSARTACSVRDRRETWTRSRRERSGWVPCMVAASAVNCSHRAHSSCSMAVVRRSSTARPRAVVANQHGRTAHHDRGGDQGGSCGVGAAGGRRSGQPPARPGSTSTAGRPFSRDVLQNGGGLVGTLAGVGRVSTYRIGGRGLQLLQDSVDGHVGHCPPVMAVHTS